MALTQLKTGAIADDAVTTDKLANAINTERTANTAKSTNATHTGDVTGSGALTIAADAVTSSKLADNAVVTAAINGGAVTNAKLAADAVTNAKIADDAIDSEHYVDGSIDTAHIADSAVTAAKIDTSALRLSRNLAMNGDMRINQKGNTSSTDHGWRIALDGWRTWHYAHGGTCTSSQGTVASGTTPYDLGFRYTYKLAMSGSLTAASGSSAFIANAVEGRNIIRSGWNYTSSNSYLTISFWVKASVAQNYTATVFMGGNRNYGWTFAVSSANTWQKITKTIPGDSSISIAANENAAAMSFYIFAWIGTDYDNHGSEANWVTYDGDEYSRPSNSGWLLSTNPVFEVTGVQIESGSTATPFEFEDYNTTLDRCQRHYIKLTGVGGAGQSYSADSVDGMRWFISWPNKMNTSPTVTRTGGSDGQSNANLAIVQSTADGCTMNLKSTDSNTSVWWYNGTVEAVADI